MKNNFLDINFAYARFLGFWHPNISYLYIAYTIVQLSLNIMYAILQILYVILYENTFADLLHIMGRIQVSFLTFYRACVWMRQQNQLREMLIFMKEKKFNDTHPIILKAHKIAYNYTVLLINLPYISIVMAYTPIFIRILKEKEYRNVKLPYEHWTPVDIYDTGLYFGIATCYQIFAYWNSIACLTIIHATILSLMVKISGHFELLAEQISQINVHDSDAEQQLDQYLRDYNDIFSVARQVADMNSAGWMGQLLPQAYVLCASIILIVAKQGNTGGDVVTCTSCLFDLFMYCWFGEQIYHHSNQMSVKLSEVDWQLGSKKFRKKFLASLVVLGDGLTFQIGGFFSLRLASFIQILRMTYSMYTVLSTFTSESLGTA